MGGELWYSTKFNTNTRISYGWATKTLDKYFHNYLVPNQYYYRKIIQRKVDIQKIIKVKDLVFEKLIDYKRANFDVSSDLIGFMLGSREVEFWGLLKIYLETIKLLNNNYRYLFFISPFIYGVYEELKDFYREVKDFVKLYGLEHSFKRVEFILDSNEKYSLLANLRLLITIPGTKTNEAGYLGIPQLVILPLQAPEHIPLWGIAGWLDFMGFIGKKIKKYIVLHYAKKNLLTKKRFIAMPNMIANQEIIPELIGIINPQNLVQNIELLLSNPQNLENMSYKLRKIYDEWEEKSLSFYEYITQFFK